MAFKKNLLLLPWLVFSIISLFFESTNVFSSTDPLPLENSFEKIRKILITRNGSPTGYKLYLFSGTGRLDQMGAHSKSATFFASNLSQINTPLFKLQNKISGVAPDISFFAPNGFRFAQQLNSIVEIKRFLHKKGAWKILKSDDMQDFDVLPLNIQDSTQLIRNLLRIYGNKETRPRNDSVVILRDESATSNFKSVTLVEIIEKLNSGHAQYRSVFISSSRVRIFGYKDALDLQSEIFDESLDFSFKSLAYSLDQGFIQWPHGQVDSLLITSQPRIRIHQWWKDLREGLRPPKSFSYAEQKLLYASLASMRDLKESFIKKARFNTGAGAMTLDNALTPKIQPHFFNYIKSIPDLTSEEYQKLKKGIKRAILNEPSSDIVRIVFSHEDFVPAALRLAARDSGATYVFKIYDNKIQSVQNTRASNLDLSNLIEYIKNLKASKSFIFTGYGKEISVDSRLVNYRQEGLAASILNTMTTLYGIYPSTIEFIDYFDNSQGRHVARDFEYAFEAISLDPLHQRQWPKFVTMWYNGQLGVQVSRIDNVHAVTSLGTLLSISNTRLSQGIATAFELPARHWKFLPINAGNKVTESMEYTDHDGLFLALDRPLLTQLDNYRSRLSLAHGSEHLLTRMYGLHMQSISDGINLCLPLNTLGKRARQALWQGMRSSVKQLRDGGVPVEVYLPDLKEYQEPPGVDLSGIETLPLLEYKLTPKSLTSEVKQSLPGEDSDSDSESSDFDLALDWSSGEDSPTHRDLDQPALNPAPSTSQAASLSCSRPNSARPTKRPRLKRSLAESTCLPYELKEKEAAYRLVAQHQAIFNALIALSPEIQAFIAAHNTYQGTKFEPIIDQDGELRILSYQKNQIYTSDPIAHLPQAAKDHIDYFNRQLTEVYETLGQGKTLSLNHFWFAYATAHYAKYGVQTDIRSLLNASVFFPNLLVESAQLPVKLVHQLKIIGILDNTEGLKKVLDKIEYRTQAIAPSLGSLEKDLSRFGSGVMLYNLVDDFIKKPDFSTATSEQKVLWSLNTATDSIFSIEAVVGLGEEITLLALPGAELLGPLGLGLFLVTEAVELAYKEHYLHKKLADENYWIKLEKNSFLKDPCSQVKTRRTTLLDCAKTTTPISRLVLNHGEISWDYGELRLSKTLLNGHTENLGSAPLEDNSWEHSLDIIKIFKSIKKKRKSLKNQSQIVMLPSMPNKQMHYHFEDEGVTFDNIELTFSSIIGNDNFERVRTQCYGTMDLQGTPEQKARMQLKISQNPEQLTYCLELLTNHRFCPEVLQSWFGGSSACQVSYMKYDYTSDMRMATRYRYQYLPTEITIELNDERSYILVAPKLTKQQRATNPESYESVKDDRAYKVSYRIQGNGQKNTLYLQAGFHYKIKVQSGEEVWALVIPPNTQLEPAIYYDLLGDSKCTRYFVLKEQGDQGQESTALPALTKLCIQGHAKINVYSTH